MYSFYADVHSNHKFKKEIAVAGYFVFPPWGEIWG